MHTRLSHALILSFALVASLVPRAAAQVPDADAKELKNYALTMAALQQFVAATRNMMVAAQADPRFREMQKLEAEIKAIEEKGEPSDADLERLEALQAKEEELDAKLPSINMASPEYKTLSDIENAIKREPMLSKALASAGMAPRDYAKFTLAFFQAGMIHGMQKSGLVKQIPKDLEASINLENLKFFDANQAAIEALMAEFKALEKQ